MKADTYLQSVREATQVTELTFLRDQFPDFLQQAGAQLLLDLLDDMDERIRANVVMVIPPQYQLEHPDIREAVEDCLFDPSQRVQRVVLPAVILNAQAGYSRPNQLIGQYLMGGANNVRNYEEMSALLTERLGESQ